MIREKYGLEKGFVIEMSGTPSPKSPVDWWSQCEIAWPGFLREGSQKAMEERMAFMVQQTGRRRVQEAHRLEGRRAEVRRVRRDARGRAARIGRHGGPRRLPRVHAQQERGRLPLQAAQGAGDDQAQEGLPGPARQAISQDHLQADREHAACGRGHRPVGPERRHRHDLAPRTERRLPVPRGAGRHDPLHALHRRHGARVDRPAGAGRDAIPACNCCLPRSWPGWSSRRCLARCAAATREVPKMVRTDPRDSLPQGSRAEDALGRERRDRPPGGVRRLHRLGGSRRQALPQGKVERRAVRSGRVPGSHARRRSGHGRAAGLLGQPRPSAGCLLRRTPSRAA